MWACFGGLTGIFIVLAASAGVGGFVPSVAAGELSDDAASDWTAETDLRASVTSNMASSSRSNAISKREAVMVIFLQC